MTAMTERENERQQQAQRVRKDNFCHIVFIQFPVASGPHQEQR